MKRYLVRGRAYMEHCKAVFLTPTIRWGDTVKVGLLLGCMSNALLSAYLDHHKFFDIEIPHVVEVAHAQLPEPEPKEILIEIVYNWSPERVEEEIRKVFTDQPGLAIAIAKCESQYDKQPDVNIQARGEVWYGRERSFGLFQIHEPAWHEYAEELGYGDYQKNPYHNIKLAKHIKDNYGWKHWTCFSKGYYHKHW